MPTWSPATTVPPDSSTISLVASPTDPMIGRAKSRVGPSIWSSSIGSAPGIANTSRFRGRPASVVRKTMASTNARGPAAATLAAYALASMPTSRARRRTDVVHGAGFELGLVQPDPHHGPQLDDGVAVLAEQLTALGVQAGLGEPVGAVELGLDDVRPPAGLPPARVLGQRRLGAVGPGLLDTGEGPGGVQRGRRGAALPIHRRHRDPRLTGAHAGHQRLVELVDLGSGGPDELHCRQVLVGQAGGQLGRRPVRGVRGPGIGRREPGGAGGQHGQGDQTHGGAEATHRPILPPPCWRTDGSAGRLREGSGL